VQGRVIHVDRFGNLVTSIRAVDVDALGPREEVVARLKMLRLPLVVTYGDLETGTPGALVGSSGRVEVAVRDGSAATSLRAGVGAPVRLSRTTPGSPLRAWTRRATTS
jgi:S-adenosylmethionine hydrolase